eukprot:1137571-Pelagomonas_calceolata.AAC.3
MDGDEAGLGDAIHAVAAGLKDIVINERPWLEVHNAGVPCGISSAHKLLCAEKLLGRLLSQLRHAHLHVEGGAQGHIAGAGGHIYMPLQTLIRAADHTCLAAGNIQVPSQVLVQELHLRIKASVGGRLQVARRRKWNF